MLLKSNVFRIVLSFSLIFCLSFVALADTIRLKDGSIIKGKIVGFRDGQFLVQIGDGSRQRQMTFFADEVAAIEFDGSGLTAGTNSTPSTTILPRPSSNTQNTAGNQTNSQSNSANNTANNSTQPNFPMGTTTIPVKNNNSQAANPQTPSPRPKPIQLNTKVLADNTANGWTNAGWVVKKGQKIRITGNGRISLGNGNYSTPAGLASLADKDKLMPSQPTGGLIAVIGDDNNDFIFIGNSREFTASRDGALFLGINEGLLDDNSGSFDVSIEIDPGS